MPFYHDNKNKICIISVEDINDFNRFDLKAILSGTISGWRLFWLGLHSFTLFYTVCVCVVRQSVQGQFVPTTGGGRGGGELDRSQGDPKSEDQWRAYLCRLAEVTGPSVMINKADIGGLHSKKKVSDIPVPGRDVTLTKLSLGGNY
jgi:hypothetical protein